MQIVNHNFCDYLGSVKRSPTSNSSGYASIQSSSCQNKVRVYVPYSTLIALTNEIRETPVDDIDEDDHDGDVVICDTQVILRINPGQQEEIQYSTCKKNNKRMTRKLLNESETFHKTTNSNQNELVQGIPVQVTNLNLPRRKDLCKLLGLNEQDVDLMIVPEVKVAQKVALSHSADLQTSRKQTAKKKDLAKFLGVDERDASIEATSNTTTETPSNSIVPDGSDTKSVSNNSIKSKDTQQRPKSLLINWGQMVKSSVKGWKFEENQSGDMEMDVPVQLRQLSSREPERTHRKDLSKYLGFDDSDSEEIVFIRNAQPAAQSASSEQASINDSSLTRKSSSFDDEDEDSDDSVGSLRSFDSFVRRSLRCGASNEFAIQMEDMEATTRCYPPKRGDVICKPRHHHSVSPSAAASIQSPPSSASPSTTAAAMASALANQRRRRKIDAEKRAQEVNVLQMSGNEPSNPIDHNKIDPSLTTLDRKPLSSQSRDKPRVMFGPNSRRMISPVRNKRSETKMPPVFRREEPLLVYPQKPPLFYQHYPIYGGFGILPPGGRINPNNGRIRVPRHPQRVPVREHPHPDY